MKCDFSHINLTVDRIPCIRTSPNLHHVTWHFPEAIPKFREVPVHFTSQGKMRVRIGEHVPRGICGKRDYHTGFHMQQEYTNTVETVQIAAQWWTGSVHDSRIVCSPRLAIFGKNSFLLFMAYSASVERWLVRVLVSALRYLPCTDVVN